MEQGYTGAEGRIEEAGHLRGEADFRDQQDGAETTVQRALHGGQINSRLSRSRDAMKQERTESPQPRHH